nr:E3 ubiquitin-protein ligase HECW2-like [Ciona intestinalis]|eukprot:XP_009857929.2 E3 ubiquitin-protein ligase HECW2-like [Ciona intestinalis]
MPSYAPEGQSRESSYISFTITGLSGFNLKKGVFFNPDPYVKLRILPGPNCRKCAHHKQRHHTKQVEDTTNPTWKEQFYIQVLRSDIIELEVKDRFDKGRPVFRRFLGKLEVPVGEILERLNCSEQRYTGALTKRTPLDHTSGSLSFVIADGRSSLFGSYPYNLNNGRSQVHRASSSSNSDLNFSIRSHSIGSFANDVSEALDECITRHFTETDMTTVTNGTLGEFHASSTDDETSPPTEETSKENGTNVDHEDMEEDPFTASELTQVTSLIHNQNGNSSQGQEAVPAIDRIIAETSEESTITSLLQTTEPHESVCDVENEPALPSTTDVMLNTQQSVLDGVESEDHVTGNASNDQVLETLDENIIPVITDGAESESEIVNTGDNFLPHEDTTDVTANKESSEIVDTKEQTTTSDTQTSVTLTEPSTVELASNTADNAAHVASFTQNTECANAANALIQNNPEQKPKVKHKPAEREKLLNLLRFAALKEASCDNSDGNLVTLTIHRNAEDNHLGFNIMGGAESKYDILRKMGIFVTRVEPASPAEHAGVQIHDRLILVNGTSVRNSSHTAAVSELKNAGHEVEVVVERRDFPLNAFASEQNSPAHQVGCSIHRRASLPVSFSSQKNRPLQTSSTTFMGSGVLRAFPARSTQELIEDELKKSPTSQKSPLSYFQPSTSPTLPKLPPSGRLSDTLERGQSLLIKRKCSTSQDKPSQEGLPPNWEACRDRHDRLFYLDHVNRVTQWERPKLSDFPPASGSNKENLEEKVDEILENLPQKTIRRVRRSNSVKGDRNYERVMMRYQSIKRVMRQTAIPEDQEASTSSSPVHEVIEPQQELSPPKDDPPQKDASPIATNVTETDHPEPTTSTSSGSRSTMSTIDESESGDNLDKNPAFQFITQPDFFRLLSTTPDAYSLYMSSSSLKLILSKINRCPQHFKDYQHNKDLVKFINCFADTSKPLPSGWEKKVDGHRKPFFIDHNLRSTTFFDPRLPCPDKPNNVENATSTSQEEDRDDTNAPDRMEVQSPLATEPPVIAPRPADSLSMRSRQKKPPVATPTQSPAQQQAVAPVSYNEKVVAFLKQSNILDILKERYPSITTSTVLAERVKTIKNEGLPALERYCNSMQLNIMLSLFEEEIMSFVVQSDVRPVLAERPRSNVDSVVSRSSASPSASPITTRSRTNTPLLRNFDSKLRSFYRKLEQKGYGQGPGKIKLTVHRDNLLEDAFRKVMLLPRKQLQRSKLFVSFAGEEGLDYSGPSREFFFLISRELFNPYYGLFEYSAVDTYTVQISPLSTFADSPHEWFRFAGRIIGLALVHHCLLDAFFTRPLYKMLLRSKCDLSDLRYEDEQFYQSIMWIKDNDITDVLDLTFSVNEEMFGKIEERELKPNGKNIAVTEKNKKEYIERMVKWRVVRGTREQTNMLIRGFNEVIDLRLVSVFDANELELVICGTADIDLNDWRQHTEYRGGYYDQHPVVINFWEALDQFDNERRLRLLQFVTGTSSIPYEGFAALRGPNGPKRFCIEKWGKPDCLPRTHTCFNRLDLPPYDTFNLLWEKLVIAIEETNTFGME